ncbi:hypothetical protein [Brevibacterium spongiae]|uniref:DUF222 domain-containing protein n=1 Tax=Brevibacterium spongiae TaxID=2909672 RepID=A0ABY5SXT1_9MICO|nr:hypothetical protein [Brevibacterium spongiae]UVI37504.1 hypothetical protein L1F31_07610 [Brevibacterium spongiae]
MDQNSNTFDALDDEAHDHRPLMPWDELLAFIRRFPQLAAVDAALIAHQRPDATVVDTEALSPVTAAGAPTWDGLHRILQVLRQKNLLPQHLPQTRSATVMLTRLLDELALILTGRRGARPELGIAAATAHTDAAALRFETECITWLIAGRLGLRAAATGTLKGYLKHGELIPAFSRDRVLHTVDAIEHLFGGALVFGETVRHEVPSLFELDDSLAV